MIEVEKKFQPTEEQLAALLADAEFVGEKTLHDIYYDYSDYRLWRKRIFLRNRDGNYELKVKVKNTKAYEEIENEEDIKKFFEIKNPLADFINTSLINAVEFTTIRKKYKKGEFIIDVDDLSFGYKCIEIELIVEQESDIQLAMEKIIELAKSYNFDIKDVIPKRQEYFRKVKPAVYNELYGQKG